MKAKEEREKAGLKLNIQETKIMTSSPITSWQIDGGKKMETVTDFIFLSSKITVDVTAAMKLKSVTVSIFFPPSICHEVMGLDVMILVS